MKIRSKVYNKIYNGTSIPCRRGLLCRIVYRQGNRFMIEFPDTARDWCAYPELIPVPKKKPVTAETVRA